MVIMVIMVVVLDMDVVLDMAVVVVMVVWWLGKGSKNQNGLKWILPLGVGPPLPLMEQISSHFLPQFFSFAIESYIYETDFTLQKYHF